MRLTFGTSIRCQKQSTPTSRFEILQKLGRVPRNVPVKTLLFHRFFWNNNNSTWSCEFNSCSFFLENNFELVDFQISHIDHRSHRSTQSIRQMLQEQEYDEDTFGFFGGDRR